MGLESEYLKGVILPAMVWRFKSWTITEVAMKRQLNLATGLLENSRLKPWQYHGSIYGITPAKIGYLKPVGQWNEETIIAIEDHIIVILNGHTVVDTFLEKTTPVDGQAHPGMKNSTGHLMLAGHNDRVEFRNLEIADFSKPPASPEKTQANQPPIGFQALFNGKDLQGWKGLHKNANTRRSMPDPERTAAQTAADKVMRDHWTVTDGILTYDGKGQSLCTDKDYGDFDLYLEWRIPPGRFWNLPAGNTASTDLGSLGPSHQGRRNPSTYLGGLGFRVQQWATSGFRWTLE